jgi:hypothetical protein
MSYEQKYLKYKQKYQELKKMLGGSAHQLETENYSEIADFTLTDTPTFEQSNKNTFGIQHGGDDNENEFNLTETPYENQIGGTTINAAPYIPATPLPSCPGQVNPMPDVSVPLPTEAVPMTTQTNNLVGGNDVSEINTTTDLSEIQNTEDIAKLFNQFGAGRKNKKSSSSSSSLSSSGSSSSETDVSDSDSF